MEHFLLSFNVVAPMFVMMALGYLCRRWLKLTNEWTALLNKLLYQLLLPFLLFRSMYVSDLRATFTREIGFLTLYVVCAMLITVGLLLYFVPKFEKENTRRGVLMQGMFRGNTALFGLPIATLLYGADNVAPVTVVLAVFIPLLNVLSVVVLELFHGGKPNARHILKSILTNKLIWGIAAGLLLNLLNIRLPLFLQTAVWDLAACATPMSFFVMGASFVFSSAARNRKALIPAVIVKLVAIPVVWLTVGILLGYRDIYLITIFTMFAPPTAVSSYPMAAELGGDKELSNEIVVFTAAFSLVSIFLILFALKSMGFM